MERAGGRLGFSKRHATARWRATQAREATRCERSVHGVDTILKFQISNSTSNIQLKPILRASITPKPRRVSKNSINKSYRSTYQLQLLFRGFGLNLNGSRVISTQSAALETITRSQT